jgi:hypothetical protein
LIRIAKDQYERAQQVFTPFDCPKCKTTLLVPGSPLRPQNQENGALLTAGWLFAFLGGWIGILFGVIIIARGKKVGTGVTLIVVSVIAGLLWYLLLFQVLGLFEAASGEWLIE